MAPSQQADTAPPRICLVGSCAELLGAGTGDSPVAAHPGVTVMIARPGGSADESAALARTRALADRHDLAFIVENDVALALEIGADGVQIAWSTDGYADARARLGPDRTIGCLTSLSRHHTMTAAEAGADYVGIGAGSGNAGRMSEFIDHIEWWAGLFEVPVVAFGADDPETVAAQITAGPEFVALYPALWTGAVLDLFSSGT